jgi:AcrR family transcriptional regulator
MRYGTDMARTTGDDWCRVGLLLLRDEGPEALTLERLCERVGRTKGSFYHHFTDMNALHAALFAAWRTSQTELPIAAASAPNDPLSARRARIDAHAMQVDHRLERVLRAWALRDDNAAQALRSVDERRLGFLEQLHREAGQPDPRTCAQLEYAAFVGAQQLGWVGNDARSKRLSEALNSRFAEPPRNASKKATKSQAAKRASSVETRAKGSRPKKGTSKGSRCRSNTMEVT